MLTQDRKSLPSTLYTEEYFLTACEGYDVFLASEGAHLSRRLRDAFAVAQVAPGMRVLDVGCGRGEIVRHCVRLGVHAIGMDYAEVATRMTREVIEAELGRGADEQRSEGDSEATSLGDSAVRNSQSPNLLISNLQSRMAGVCQADAKRLPFPTNYFDRVLMFDVVEHLFPWELHRGMLEVKRVLKPGGRFIIHTAPNRWYDAYAYPWVRRFRTLLGHGDRYPTDPRAITPVNQDVHVNEQDILSMRRALRQAGFSQIKVWLDSPPQEWNEGPMLNTLRRLAFRLPPFRWFFERELFAVAEKQ
jgi:cyclopropane fatty-acyl-phospholipid synthase-like methyltransferase